MSAYKDDGKHVMTDATIECQANMLPNLKAMDAKSADNIQGGCVTNLHLQALGRPNTVLATCEQGTCKWL